ncbi:MAG: NAD(P)H-hydrate dehydratase [Promethearchaeota archaeon]|nr:MAG: NAD(P)H-hydrate dehydratase [Candidatus Lokiarchaeota archaeon]
MKPFNSKKITSEEMAILDNNSEWLGIPKSHLMECAGYSFATEIMNRGYFKPNSKAVIFCGTGNNGGDGFVVARHLSSYGVKSLLILIGDPDKIRTDEGDLNWKIIANNLHYSIEIEKIKDSTELTKIEDFIKKDKAYHIIIDGLLGTGIEGKIREPIASAIALINSLKENDSNRFTVVCIDVPSGLNPNSGKVSDTAVKADLLITFHRLKKGMTSSNEYMKEIVEKSIGIPPEASMFVGRGNLIPTLKKRKKDAHKGEFGKILIIGGSKNYSGAPAYASLAGINFGIDLVITYVPEVIADALRSYSPNMIIRAQTGDYLNMKALEELTELIKWSDSVLIGPGLGKQGETEVLFVELLKRLKEYKKPFVLDADALKLVKNHLEMIKGLPALLTPHEGELKIMSNLNLPPYDNLIERSNTINELAKKLNLTLLVKGPYDYISDGKQLKINKTGCPEMSIGGTGDVLAGLCSSFISIKNKPFDSACSAAFLNGIIGEFCKKNLGNYFTALDMVKNIGKTIRDVMNF